jgi:hypothetical protein
LDSHKAQEQFEVALGLFYVLGFGEKGFFESETLFLQRERPGYADFVDVTMWLSRESQTNSTAYGGYQAIGCLTAEVAFSFHLYMW